MVGYSPTTGTVMPEALCSRAGEWGFAPNAQPTRKDRDRTASCDVALKCQRDVLRYVDQLRVNLGKLEQEVSQVCQTSRIRELLG